MCNNKNILMMITKANAKLTDDRDESDVMMHSARSESPTTIQSQPRTKLSSTKAV